MGGGAWWVRVWVGVRRVCVYVCACVVRACVCVCGACVRVRVRDNVHG